MNDRTRIEYALIPALLESYLLINNDDNTLTNHIAILTAEWRKYFTDVKDIRKRHALYRRFDRITNIILNYTKKEHFSSRKGILAITEWFRALAEAGYLIIDPGSAYFTLLEEFGDIILEGYKTIDNFEKIDASAINHVSAIHKLANREGYFL